MPSFYFLECISNRSLGFIVWDFIEVILIGDIAAFCNFGEKTLLKMLPIPLSWNTSPLSMLVTASDFFHRIQRSHTFN